MCCGHGAVHVGVLPGGGACARAREHGVRSGRTGWLSRIGVAWLLRIIEWVRGSCVPWN
jgi:hypothetical protein